MKVIRRIAKQPHSVPSHARYPLGNSWWTPEDIIETNLPKYAPDMEITYEKWTPYNATAQNNYQGDQYYSCNECGEYIPESLLDEHVCEEDEEE